MRFYYNNNEILNEQQFEEKVRNETIDNISDFEMEDSINYEIDEEYYASEILKLSMEEQEKLKKRIAEKVLEAKIEDHRRDLIMNEYIPFEVDFKTGTAKHV